MVVLVFAVGFTARLAYEEITHPGTPAYAQDDLNCADFRTQAEAQAELQRDPTDPNNLDADFDGVACEELDGDGSVADDQYDNGDDPAPTQPGLGRSPRTGGPKTDVFPLLDDGGCPTPLVKRDGACYP